MRKLLVLAHDPSPNTRAMVQAVLDGAADEAIKGVEARHVRPLEANAEDVLGADAVVFGTTENLGYMSGALKDFFDRCFYDVIEKTDAMPYAMFIRAGKDGTGTRRAIESICGGLNWKAVQEPLICHGEWNEDFLHQCQELGMAMAAGLEAEIF
ncbi:flavodoxin family protein [Wenzhouxiangella sp. AB-CW3]|uniref:flavodoxin family protein n=1 Tax=Wenzhouxiangella sp. AB-CW3 TaxID=2771012 RepID=UPI00168B68A7|nr:NAD(P)H-dependent oxidoreductase [Wenzhouxiangella sp. AB-CW3]QOC23270.1 flavodoxin family protein [Wenzhouxiangella sp. AB-CW3]